MALILDFNCWYMCLFLHFVDSYFINVNVLVLMWHHYADVCPSVALSVASFNA